MACLLKGRIDRLLWVMLAAGLLATSSAFAEEGVVLKYHHSPGDRAVYEFTLSTTARAQEEGGESAKIKVDTELECRAEYLGDTASGDWGILGTITSGTSKMMVDDEEESVEIGEDISARYVVSPCGEIASFRLLRGEVPRAVFGGEGILLEPADVFLLSGAAVFPEVPLKPGDRWQGVARVPLLEGGGVHEQPYESVFLGPAEYCGSQCWKIKTTGKAEAEEMIPSFDGLGYIEATLELSTEATWLYDPERGVIASVDSTDRIAMTIAAMVGEQGAGKATVTGVVNVRSRLIEFNGVKIAAQ